MRHLTAGRPHAKDAAGLLGPITVGPRARVGANAVVTDDVPEGATMIGLKARSTLVPAETWLKEFIPYGTPCKEPCEPQGGNRVDDLEAEVATLKAQVAALIAGQAVDDGITPAPPPSSRRTRS